jgi:hypothetical protein
MSSTRKKTTNAEALDQINTSVQRVTSTIQSVLAKYPQNTLSPALVPFVQRHWAQAIRRSHQDDEIVLVISTFFSKTTNLRFPVALLDAQESEITRWARDQYWSAIREAKLRARREAHANTEKARRAVAKAQHDLETAQRQLAVVSALADKPRAGRASQNTV